MVMAIDPRGRVLNPLVADVCGQQCFAYRGQFVVKAGESVAGTFRRLGVRCWSPGVARV